MLDFLKVEVETKTGSMLVKPNYDTIDRKDLMTRNNDFYAVWCEEQGIWSNDEDDAKILIDSETERVVRETKEKYPDARVRGLYLRSSGSKAVDAWHHYCQHQLRDKYKILDQKLTFLDTKPSKRDYASSKRLDYPLQYCDTPCYDELMSTLYSPEERHKLEWAIGSIVTGASRDIQKFVVLYGGPGTGKSTVLKIVERLFKGYSCSFDARALGDKNNQFSMEPFKNDPLVAIQHDGDLSKIEVNERLNSIISHEMVTVNLKKKSTYDQQFHCFLFIGSNKPVKITDAKSGLLRRLIDVSPTGNRLLYSDYRRLMNGIEFELGGIACHCRDVFLEDPEYYDDYIPNEMMEATNDFYNFVIDSLNVLADPDGVTLNVAWELYNNYCERAKQPYSMKKTDFKEEIKSYYTDIYGKYNNLLYKGFRYDKIDRQAYRQKPKKPVEIVDPIIFSEQPSWFDSEMEDAPAQYATSKETPSYKWDSVTTRLRDIDTHQLHYVKIPENHIVIDFDIPGPDGKKNFEANLKAASEWPKTYAELSKSGAGIHLHYIYTGDPEKLDSVFSEHIEIKVYKGNSSLRRKLTKCNDIPIACINSGLPLKGETKRVFNQEDIKNQTHLINSIRKALRREVGNGRTKPSIDYIYMVLETAYNNGVHYTIPMDLRNDIRSFASASTNNSSYCRSMVSKMHFCSKDIENEDIENEAVIKEKDDREIAIFDVETAPNHFLIVLKRLGKPRENAVILLDPKPIDIDTIVSKYKLVGFNNINYDNPMVYAARLGYSPQELFKLSQSIINDGARNPFYDSKNISYADIWQISSDKQGLKAWEIQLEKQGMDICHKEFPLPWDQPIDDEHIDMWEDYCVNDVVATDAVFNTKEFQGDWVAHKILAEIAGGTMNDTTNQLTTKLIFGNNRHPELVYTDLSKQFPGYSFEFGEDGKPHNMYKGIDVGFGGYVWAKPGMYGRTKTYDVASLHPHSAIELNYFGEYTRIFKELVDTRIYIKHGDYETAKRMFKGKLAGYLDDPGQANQLSKALKIAINSVYGLTSAKFDNAFRDPRNKNNIIALRGALFMCNLKDIVEKAGYEVIHIKTDSIKVVNPDPKVEKIIMDYGKQFGYDFEVEHSFDRICLINDAVYIGKLAEDDPKKPGEWEATGTEFAVPYVFKTLFSHEDISFYDMCEKKQVKTSMYLDMNEKTPDEHHYIFVGRVGLFTPMQPGCGAGTLLREDHGKYSAVVGTKGYLWMESTMVKEAKLEDKIDKSYYEKLVSEAVEDMAQFGDVEMFLDSFEELHNKPMIPLEVDPLPDGWDSIAEGGMYA